MCLGLTDDLIDSGWFAVGGAAGAPLCVAVGCGGGIVEDTPLFSCQYQHHMGAISASFAQNDRDEKNNHKHSIRDPALRKGERNASALDPPEGHLVAKGHGTHDISGAREIIKLNSLFRRQWKRKQRNKNCHPISLKLAASKQEEKRMQARRKPLTTSPKMIQPQSGEYSERVKWPAGSSAQPPSMQNLGLYCNMGVKIRLKTNDCFTKGRVRRSATMAILG